LEREFVLTASNFVLGANERNLLKGLPMKSGCYFWVARFDNRDVKLYIGRTKSLRKRVKDYSIEFQVGAANDFKLRLVLGALASTCETLEVNLYFKEIESLDELKAAETELVRSFRPLVNSLPPPSQLEREMVLEAYRSYYVSVLTRHLRVEA
jgi:excinuclease UvrABC nuclease subunit